METLINKVIKNIGNVEEIQNALKNEGFSAIVVDYITPSNNVNAIFADYKTEDGKSVTVKAHSRGLLLRVTENKCEGNAVDIKINAASMTAEIMPWQIPF